MTPDNQFGGASHTKPGHLETGAATSEAAVDLKERALDLSKAPIPELEGMFPVVLYFKTDAHREAFVSGKLDGSRRSTVGASVGDHEEGYPTHWMRVEPPKEP